MSLRSLDVCFSEVRHSLHMDLDLSLDRSNPLSTLKSLPPYLTSLSALTAPAHRVYLSMRTPQGGPSTSRSLPANMILDLARLTHLERLVTWNVSAMRRGYTQQSYGSDGT